VDPHIARQEIRYNCFSTAFAGGVVYSPGILCIAYILHTYQAPAIEYYLGHRLEQNHVQGNLVGT
jgi:hypothetical protein